MSRVHIGAARVYRGRAEHRNPMRSACALHLRVVCGVCSHFDGALRGRGRCGLLNLDLAGGRNAETCEFWERRWSTEGQGGA